MHLLAKAFKAAVTLLALARFSDASALGNVACAEVFMAINSEKIVKVIVEISLNNCKKLFFALPSKNETCICINKIRSHSLGKKISKLDIGTSTMKSECPFWKDICLLSPI
jgi:hypothetical protein